MENNHFVYIIKCKDDTLYTGYTNDVEERFKKHQNGKGAKYTRGRGPLMLMYMEELATKEEAMSREYAIKKLTRKEKLKLIKSSNQKGESSDANSKQLSENR